MRANRAAHEQYAQGALSRLGTSRDAAPVVGGAVGLHRQPVRAETLDVLCHVNYNLWHTDFLDTYWQADNDALDLSDPFSGLRKVVESARGTLDTWREVKANNSQAKVGRWVNGANVSVSRLTR